MKESLPKLNMAIPRPASESMEMDLAMMAGIVTFHLSTTKMERKRRRHVIA